MKITIPFKRKSKIRTHRSTLDQHRARRAQARSVKWRGEKRPGGGWASMMNVMPFWQGTTRQTCGMWPWVNGSAAPIYGAQIGVHFYTREPIGFDPLHWFDKRFIFNPSVFLLSNPAVGKSTLLRKMMIGVIAAGTNVLVLGDRKNEHTQLIEMMGGQIIHLGPGRGIVNILDPGGVIEAMDAIDRFCADRKHAKQLISALLGDMHSRRLNLVTGLLSIYRHTPVSGHESSIIDAALRWLYANEDRIPILTDLLRVIRDAPDDVRRIANDHGDIDRYVETVRNIENDLVGLTSGGGIGQMFNGQTTQRLKRDRSVAFDLSSIDENDKEALSAAYLACWASGFGMINVAHALADALDENDTPLEDAQRFFAVLDEFWQPMGASKGMVDYVNAITRLNRDKGVATAYASHTLRDLESLPDENDRAKARGIVSRCGAVVLGGLDRDELTERVSRVARLRKEEVELLVSWNIPPSLDGNEDMPGRGKFLIKIGEAPGVPVEVKLTDRELRIGIHDTNKRIARREKATA